MQPLDETFQNLQQILILNYENSVQSKNRQAIAAEYGIHVSTLRRTRWVQWYKPEHLSVLLDNRKFSCKATTRKIPPECIG